MDIEFNFQRRQSYKEFLAGQQLEETIDIPVLKAIRGLVGSMEDIFKKNTDDLTGALRDIRYFIDRTNAYFEIISLNLWQVAKTRRRVDASVEGGFQALFVKGDEFCPALAHLHSIDEAHRGHAADWITTQYHAALDLLATKHYREALEVVRLTLAGTDQRPACAGDHRLHYLHGVLLSGTPGEQKSIEVVDLAAAEQAFLAAARTTPREQPSATSLAYVGAGKAACALGRLERAEQHYRAALAVAPQCGEANYQLARLRMHAKDLFGVQKHLSTAFDIHWSFALRAGSDVLFFAHSALVEKCVVATTSRLVSEARRRIDKLIGGVKFLKEREDKDYAVEAIGGVDFVATSIRSVQAPMHTAGLKKAFHVRKEMASTGRKLAQFVQDYCLLLRNLESLIVVRQTKHERGYDPERWAVPVADILPRAVRVVAIAVVGATIWLNLQPTDPSLSFATTDRFPFLAFALLAYELFRLAPGGISTTIYQRAVDVISRVQISRIAAEQKRNLATIRRNRAALHQRLTAIEQHFGLDRTPSADCRP